LSAQILKARTGKKCSLQGTQLGSIPPGHLRSEIAFSRTCNIPNFISCEYRIALFPLETLHWLSAWLRNCMSTSTFVQCKIFLEGTLLASDQQVVDWKQRPQLSLHDCSTLSISTDCTAISVSSCVMDRKT